MKPRDGWTIADGGASARRKDGVVACFHFLGREKPYAVQRPYTSPRRGRSMEYLRRAGSLTPMEFRSLEQAMAMADNYWPIT